MNEPIKLPIHDQVVGRHSMRCMRVADLLSEELEEFLSAGSAEPEGHPSGSFASQPDPDSAIREGADSE